jgi:hypothetical protein
MPLALRAIKKINNFNLPLSYKADETGDKFKDSLNCFFNNGKLESRHGYTRYNENFLGGAIKSLSYFKSTAGTRYIIAKADEALISVAESGLHTSLNGFILDQSVLDEEIMVEDEIALTANTKHRGITLNNRHIIAVESDGLFQYNGSVLTQLGQDAPSAPSVAASGSGNTITASDYKVNITYYDSTNGFETNAVQSATVTVSSGQKIAVTSIPTDPENANIDKVRVYLEDVTAATNPFFIAEINLGTTSYNITADSTSAQEPPTKNAKPLAGGAKYLTEFNTQLVYAGNSTFPNDVFFSEPELPDALNDLGTTERLFVSGNGDITGLATGFYNDSNLDPYLVIFKRKSTHIYSNIGGNTKFVQISDEVGCVSHDTIIVKNGDVYFLSTGGWRVISNGRFFVDRGGDEFKLADGLIDDIFTTPTTEFSFALNKNNMSNFFSVHYSTLDHYMTWVNEGTSTDFAKVYNYELDTNHFRPYSFTINATAATVAEDSTGEEIVLFADADGFIYKHSVKEARTDVDSSNASTAFNVFALINWFNGTEDYDASYSFRELIIKAITSSNNIEIRAFVNYIQSNETILDYSFPDPSSGFILDVSKLDEGSFGDDRTIVKARGDINRTGINILIGFYQEIAGANINLVNGQLHFNKNGNPNI